MRAYEITPHNIRIPDSYEVSKHGFDAILDSLKLRHPDCEVWKRKRWSLKFEWATHNALYSLGIKREKTKDCDLDYPPPWYLCISYNIIGALVWPFIK